MKVKLKKLSNDAVMPTRGSEQAAGYDLYADCNKTMECGETVDEGTWKIAPHTTKMIGTGIAVKIPDGYCGFIFARSGLASKRGLRPANCVGLIDSDYTGELIVALHNDNYGTQEISKGDRIAQLVIAPYLPVEFEECGELKATERGSGGFGSTGQ